jgi:hypothetical protein
MAIKAMDLFDAYSKDMLPKDQGYIISSFFGDKSAYAIYEVVSYSGVKSIYATEDGLTFQTSGKKLHILIEPASYAFKAVEPYVRQAEEQIPLRFSELDILTAKNQTKLMVSQKPIESFGSFTILKPRGLNFSIVFFNLDDLYDSLGLFFEKTFNKEAGLPMADAKKGSQLVVSTMKNNMSFKGDYTSE